MAVVVVYYYHKQQEMCQQKGKQSEPKFTAELMNDVLGSVSTGGVKPKLKQKEPAVHDSTNSY